MKKINENAKVTLTLKQLKRLVKEAKTEIVSERMGSNEGAVARWLASNLKKNGIEDVTLLWNINSSDAIEKAISAWNGGKHLKALKALYDANAHLDDEFNSGLDDNSTSMAVVLSTGDNSTGKYNDIICLTSSPTGGDKVVSIEAKTDPKWALSSMRFKFSRTNNRWVIDTNYTSNKIPEKNKKLMQWLAACSGFVDEINDFVNDFITDFNDKFGKDSAGRDIIANVKGKLSVAHGGKLQGQYGVLSLGEYARKELGLNPSMKFTIDGRDAIEKYFGTAYLDCDYVACGGTIRDSNWAGDDHIAFATEAPKLFTVSGSNPYEFADIKPIEEVGTGIGVQITITYDSDAKPENTYVPIAIRGKFFLYDNSTDTTVCSGYQKMTV